MSVWPLWKRIGFRFLFVYFVVYLFPAPLDYVPFVGDHLMIWWNAIWRAFARPFVHGVVATGPNGSGDGVWGYARIATFAGIAALATLIWSVLDRRRPNYVRLHQYLHAYVRLMLAVAMLDYGVQKVIPAQFRPPPLDRLLQTYGSSSPMGILWTFMGASMAYTKFAGAMEVLAGLLLIPRRTALLGALVTIGMMSNIVALNLFYDVPVKLYSLHLLMTAVFLAAPDLRKLLDFFVLRPAEPLFPTRALQVTAVVLSMLVVLTTVYLSAKESLVAVRKGNAARSPLRGIWNVDVLDVDGIPRPPLVTDSTRWRRLVFDVPTRSSIFLMNDERLRYKTEIDPKTQSLTFVNVFDRQDKFGLTYSRLDATTLQVDGLVAGRKIHAVCKLADEQPYLLLTRGSHWINEQPFNR